MPDAAGNSLCHFCRWSLLSFSWDWQDLLRHTAQTGEMKALTSRTRPAAAITRNKNSDDHVVQMRCRYYLAVACLVYSGWLYSARRYGKLSLARSGWPAIGPPQMAVSIRLRKLAGVLCGEYETMQSKNWHATLHLLRSFCMHRSADLARTVATSKKKSAKSYHISNIARAIAADMAKQWLITPRRPSNPTNLLWRNPICGNSVKPVLLNAAVIRVHLL